MLKAYKSIIYTNKLKIFKPLSKKLRKYTPFTQFPCFCFNLKQLCISFYHLDEFELD